MGRFLNADALVSTGQGILGNNMFAYCLNNPVNSKDRSGCFTEVSTNNKHSLDTKILTGGAGAAGIVIPIDIVDQIADAITGTLEWIDEQKKAITDKLAESLARAVPRSYKTEYEEHHIAAKKAPNAAPAANILRKVFPLHGVEDPYNKIAVKTNVHRRIHTTLYYTLANQLVIEAYATAGNNTKQQYKNVVSALGVLRLFIEGLNALSPN